MISENNQSFSGSANEDLFSSSAIVNKKRQKDGSPEWLGSSHCLSHHTGYMKNIQKGYIEENPVGYEDGNINIAVESLKIFKGKRNFYSFQYVNFYVSFLYIFNKLVLSQKTRICTLPSHSDPRNEKVPAKEDLLYVNVWLGDLWICSLKLTNISGTKFLCMNFPLYKNALWKNGMVVKNSKSRWSYNENLFLFWMKIYVCLMGFQNGSALSTFVRM